jgi:hypothetical protein
MRNFNRIIIFLIAFLAIASGGPAQANEKTQFHRSIILMKSTIKIDGKEVWLGDRIENWISTISGKARCSHKRNSLKLCVWDDMGLEIGTDLVDTTRVAFVNINLAFDQYTAPADRLPAAPTGLFGGHLELDGFAFNATTQFRQVGLHADRMRELTCGGRSCGSPYGLFSEAARLYFRLDRGSDKGYVVRMSIDCFSTEKCAALIPVSKDQKN